MDGKDIQIYQEKMLKNIIKMDSLLDSFFSNMEKWIIDDLVKSYNKIKTADDVEEFIRKVYDAKSWSKMQTDVFQKSNEILKSVYSVWSNEIKNLNKIYPDNNFNDVTLEMKWKEFENILKTTNSLDVYSTITKTEQEAKLMLYSSGALQVMDNISDVYEYLKRNISMSLGKIKTLVMTSQFNYFNQARQLFFNKVPIKGIRQYIYTGPVDSKNRAFCRDYVGQTKTEAQWSRINNGQTNGSVWINRGGYNCRHYFLLVPDTYSKADFMQLASDFRGGGLK